MASIKTMLRGYICDDREKNWSREYATREILKHKQKGIIDHPDKSITTEKLKDACITENKLSEDVLNRFLELNNSVEVTKSNLIAESSARKNADNEKANKDLSNIDDVVFKAKSKSAGVGEVKSVNGKTGDVVLDASDVGAITKEEVVSLIDDTHSAAVFPRFRAIDAEVATKATNDLSNVSDEDFLAKLNAVLPDGDEVSY